MSRDWAVRALAAWLVLIADTGCDDSLPAAIQLPAADSDEPFYLSQTALYRDIATKELSSDLRAFAPKYALWSDGADKQRWLRLPEGARIDTSQPDHWMFPVGTMMFKEFKIAGRRIETRLITRTGTGPSDYFMGAFLWDDSESDARFVPDGVIDARDTSHDVPRIKQCGTCHNGEAGRILGFSAVQQPEAPAELLTGPPEDGFVTPGDDTTAAALGYLSANCGHCHNEDGAAWPDTDVVLRLSVSDRRAEDTALYRSVVGVKMSNPGLRAVRVVPGVPELSGVYYRMQTRGPDIQMPPIATELVDPDGLSAVAAWITRLAP